MSSDLARRPIGPLLVALVATVATLATLAPDGRGPGVTCDELYHVLAGKRLVTALRHQGLDFFDRPNIENSFPWKPGGAPVQAPLGHWILGWTHHLFDPAPAPDPRLAPNAPEALRAWIAGARVAPALAFGLLVLLVGLWTARVEGHLA
ncbi:MAG: hypothetical protein ACYSWU_01295, partial [Planctomycetota bacterium]